MRAVSVLRHSATYLGASAAFAIVAPAAYAASFDCAKASTGMERLVCGDAALGARDEIMARLYAAALKAGKRDGVEARQRKWLRTAQICNASVCLAEAYDRRNAELQRSEGGTIVGTDFFSEEPKGNHATLNVVGPVHGFASVSLSSTYIGAGGEEAGDVLAIGTDALLDLREGHATYSDGPCRLAFAPLNADRWEVTQSGTCELPGGTVFAGVYRRLP